MSVPPLYGRLYEVPFDPVTWIEAALVSVTVRVTVCPDVMLLELALMDTVGTAAEALAVKADIGTKVRKTRREGPKDFISSHDVHSSRFALWCEVSRQGISAQMDRGWTDIRTFDAVYMKKGSNPKRCTVVTTKQLVPEENKCFRCEQDPGRYPSLLFRGWLPGSNPLFLLNANFPNEGMTA